MTYELGEIIAIRELSLIDESGVGRRVEVRIGKPTQFPDSTDYYAPFQITGIGSEKVLCAGGVDALQALQGVMVVVGAQLQALNSQHGGRLRWEGDSTGGFGFPDVTAPQLER